MFTENDLRKAIENGIFDSQNNVTATPSTVIRFFEVWAKEREKQIRHKAVEIAISSINVQNAHRDIMNISL